MKRPTIAPLGAANPERVRHLMEYLVTAFEQYCGEMADEERLPYLDAFMGVHNFHKAIVMDLVEKQPTLADRILLLKIARDTWDQMIQEAIRKLNN